MGSEEQVTSPYLYGIGNGTVKDESLVTEASPYYYRFGRLRRQATTNVQHTLGELPVRFLLGVGIAHVRITSVPRDQGDNFAGSRACWLGRGRVVELSPLAHYGARHVETFPDLLVFQAFRG